MTTPRRTILALAAASAIALPLAAYAQTAPTVMRVSHQLPPNHHLADVVENWAKDIETRTKGAIDVQLFGSGQLFKPAENFPAVAKGDAECAFSVNFQWGRTIPEMNATLRPFAVTDVGAMRRWAGSGPARQLEDLLEKKGVRNVTWLFITNTAAFTSRGRFLKAPEDFRGVKIRGLNPLVDSGLVAMKAAPSSMAGGEVYQALQTGVLDAGLTDVSAVYSRKYYEVQDHAVVTPLFSVFLHGYCNPRWLDRLDAAQREAIRAAGQAAAEASIVKAQAEAAGAPAQLRDKGMKVHVSTPQEIEAFKAAMLPAFDAAFDKAAPGTGTALLESIRALGGN